MNEPEHCERYSRSYQLPRRRHTEGGSNCVQEKDCQLVLFTLSDVLDGGIAMQSQQVGLGSTISSLLLPPLLTLNVFYLRVIWIHNIHLG